jgi:hypothetical protein
VRDWHADSRQAGGAPGGVASITGVTPRHLPVSLCSSHDAVCVVLHHGEQLILCEPLDSSKLVRREVVEPIDRHGQGGSRPTFRFWKCICRRMESRASVGIVGLHPHPIVRGVGSVVVRVRGLGAVKRKNCGRSGMKRVDASCGLESVKVEGSSHDAGDISGSFSWRRCGGRS